MKDNKSKVDLKIDFYKDVISKYGLKSYSCSYAKLEIVNSINSGELKNIKRKIKRKLPSIIEIVKKKEEFIKRIGNPSQFGGKFPRPITKWINDNWGDLLSKEAKFIVTLNEIKANYKPKGKKHKDIDYLPPFVIEQLKWRDKVLKKINEQRGGTLYCDNPSSDYHIFKIPLDIGDYTPEAVARNNKNPNLATIDHIYPKKHFEALQFDISNIQVLSKKENQRKAGDFVIDYRNLHIENFLKTSTKDDIIIDNWGEAMNAVHQMPIFKQTRGGTPITKMKLILEDNRFFMVGMSSFDPEIWATEKYPFLWDLNGQYLHNKRSKKMNLNFQFSYLKRFEKENKMDLILKQL